MLEEVPRELDEATDFALPRPPFSDAWVRTASRAIDDDVGGAHAAATLGIDTVMAGIVVLDNESTYVENGLFCRTAIDPMQPNGWVAVEAAWNNPASGSSVRNTTALSLPAGANATTNLLVQFALGVRKKSGAAGNPRCQLVVKVSRSNA